MKSMIFEYAILRHNVGKTDENEGHTEMIQAPKSILATSDRAVLMIAARSIPAELLDDIDNIEVIVRNF